MSRFYIAISKAVTAVLIGSLSVAGMFAQIPTAIMHREGPNEGSGEAPAETQPKDTNPFTREYINEWYTNHKKLMAAQAARAVAQTQSPDEQVRKENIGETRIGQHQIGESFQEFLSTSHVLDDLDRARGRGRHKYPDVDRVACSVLSAVRDGKKSPVTVDENHSHKYEWIFAGGKLGGVEITEGDPVYTSYGQSHGQALYFQQEIAFLTQAYGPPSDRKTVPCHNAYGAQWNRSEACWKMPDGTVIQASEHIDFDKQGRLLAINITSAEYIEAHKQPAAPNPYQ
jgi:hypothetical protein